MGVVLRMTTIRMVVASLMPKWRKRVVGLGGFFSRSSSSVHLLLLLHHSFPYCNRQHIWRRQISIQSRNMMMTTLTRSLASCCSGCLTHNHCWGHHHHRRNRCILQRTTMMTSGNFRYKVCHFMT